MKRLRERKDKRGPARLKSRLLTSVLILGLLLAVGCQSHSPSVPAVTSSGNNIAPFWAALAASFSAITSAFILITQKAKLKEDIRPELVLLGWSRSDVQMGGRPETRLRIQKLKNSGRGSALHVYMNAFEIADDDRPVAFSPTRMIDYIASDEEVTLDHEITIHWNNIATELGNGKLCTTKLQISAHDTSGLCVHLTTYQMMVTENQEPIFTTETVGPGIMAHRSVRTESITWRKIKSKLAILK